MANIFIIHGAFGNPDENWFPWLKNELEKLGQKVFVPQFPTPENQNLANWQKVFQKYEQYLDKDTIVIGHSLGVPFLLHVLESLEKPISSAFFIAGLIKPLNNPEFDSINKTFTEKEFNWSKIRKNCHHFFVFHSDNDLYVPIEQAKELAANLNTELIIVKNAGHFNKDAGYSQFDLLLEKIKEVL